MARTSSPVACLGLAGLAAALLLAGCSAGASTPGSTGTGSPFPTGSATPTVSATGSATPAPTTPLTGQPASSAAALARPIVVVDVTMTGTGANLRGIGLADLVYQEFDRPGTSRLIAAYQSRDASVGPVASTAPVDPRITALMGLPVLAFDGGPTGFVKQVGPTVVTPRSTASFASLFSHTGPLAYVSTAALRASAPNAAAAPQGLLPFGGPTVAAASGVRKVTRLSLSVPGEPLQTWAFNGQAWVGPGGVTVTNIVIQSVPYKTVTSAKDPTVHSAQIIGTGVATVIGNGFAATCTWSRPQPLQITNFFDAHSLPVALTPGRTWIILAPPGSRATTS